MILVRAMFIIFSTYRRTNCRLGMALMKHSHPAERDRASITIFWTSLYRGGFNSLDAVSRVSKKSTFETSLKDTFYAFFRFFCIFYQTNSTIVR